MNDLRNREKKGLAGFVNASRLEAYLGVTWPEEGVESFLPFSLCAIVV